MYTTVAVRQEEFISFLPSSPSCPKQNSKTTQDSLVQLII